VVKTRNLRSPTLSQHFQKRKIDHRDCDCFLYVSESKKDHKDCDSFMAVFLTHGDSLGKIFGIDECITIDKLVEPLKNCESLNGKPKLIVIQVSHYFVSIFHLYYTHSSVTYSI